MASAPDPSPWPFLAVLLSSPRRQKGDDGPEPPRVRGLGFVYGDVVVTLAHIAEAADLADLATEETTRAVRPLTVEGGLALMTLASPPAAPVPVRLEAGAGEVAVAVVGDFSPAVRVVSGRFGRREPDGRFTIALDGRLGEDHTASGSPVVADGSVVGIVGPTATSGSVDGFEVSAIQQLLESADMDPTGAEKRSSLSSATVRALGYALDIVVAVGPAAAVLLGVLRSGADDARETVPAQLLSRIDLERFGAVYERFTGPLSRAAPRFEATGMTDEQLRDSAVGSTLAAAQAIRVRVGEERLHRRHLLAAALLEPAGAFPDGFFDELGSSHAELRRALQDVIASTYEPHDAWDRVLADAPPAFDLAGGVSADLVDPTTGIPLARDHLGLRVDVTMFATLVADTKTPMPLSIGLFGEWGSGKSYFMALLRRQIDELSRSPDPRYRSEIVQIGFNAWHYADSNLWASLGDEIFEQLAGPQGQSTAARREALRSALDDRLQRRRELKAASARAQAETARLTAELDRATAERGTSARALAKAVLDAPELPGQLGPAFDRLGAGEPNEQVRLLAAELEQAPADLAVARRAVAGAPRWALAAGAAVAVAAIAAGVAASHEAAGVAVAALTLLTAAGGIAARVRSGARLLHQVADGLRRGQEAAVAKEVQRLHQAETSERVVHAQLDDVIQQVGELRRELAELTPGQRLYRFVAERAASDAYRGQLGLISTIRKDFEQLTLLMKEWRAEDGAGDARRPIDRIVLYIDDLDRCSPEQVVEVLQAVHLLLALDLFVVVVGVDPRWLLHSLRREYRSMLTEETLDPRWQSTPQDYLEKIFNIPFALPRMTARTFEQLVGSFVETEAEAESQTAEPAARAERPQAAVTPEAPETSALAGEITVTPAEPRSEIAALHAGTPEPERRPLTPDELKMLTALAPLVETPRETKRLVNLYRMMRSTRDLSPAARFLGDDAAPGEYQAVVILLGLLSGHARLLNDVLVAPPREDVPGGLRGRAPTERWADFAAGLAPRETGGGFRNDVVGEIPASDVEEWTRLAGGLADVSARVTIPDLRPFQTWAPRIARFSFLLSPYADEG